MRWISKIKTFAYLAVVTAFTVLLLDLAAYWMIPKNLVGFAPAYRYSPPAALNPAQSLPNSARGYPRGYFRADEILGFDIRENVKAGSHVFADAAVEIFSDDIGCFDKHSASDIQRNKTFDYFAGDSFTWGYADWENKFPTVYEREASRFAVKCGVTHTGQLHQYGKFKKIADMLGMYPQRVFVGYSFNDPSNDFAHPHTTVIDGFQVDIVEVTGNNNLIRLNMDEVRATISEWLENPSNRVMHETSSGFSIGIKNFLKQYSLSTNLLIFGRDELIKFLIAAQNPVNVRQNFYKLNDLYSFGEDYSTNKFTQKNRAAIQQWARDAKENSYQLIFLLIPPQSDFDNIKYFIGLKKFLAENNIRYIDLTAFLKQSGRKVDYFYWHFNGHLNNAGNEFVGEILARQFKNE